MAVKFIDLVIRWSWVRAPLPCVTRSLRLEPIETTGECSDSNGRTLDLILSGGGVSIIDFGISKKESEAFYAKSYAAARDFLSTWDWEAYLKLWR